MTDTLNVLSHLRELEVSWRKQNFQFTKQQQEEYNLLLQARRDRVAYFYENDLVSRGSKVTQDKLDDEIAIYKE
jgi:hypothetical protein